MLNLLAYAQTWGLLAALGWTSYCAVTFFVEQHQAKAPNPMRSLLSHSAMWLAGFAGTSVLLHIVRIPWAPSPSDTVVKSPAQADFSKLSKVASARD